MIVQLRAVVCRSAEYLSFLCEAFSGRILDSSTNVAFPCFTVVESFIVIIIIIYPLTARVVGAPQMISQLVSSFFSVLHCPLRLGELQACPFPDVVFPLHLPSALSCSPCHCALQNGFGQTWWTGDMSIPLQFASLYDGQEVFVWSDCLLNLGTDFLVGNMMKISLSQVGMPSYCCSYSGFLQSHYTVLLSSFLLPFSCISWCWCSLPCISQSLQVRNFSFSDLSFLSHRSRTFAVSQGYFLLTMFEEDFTGYVSHCCVEGGDHWIHVCIFIISRHCHYVTVNIHFWIKFVVVVETSKRLTIKVHLTMAWLKHTTVLWRR